MSKSFTFTVCRSQKGVLKNKLFNERPNGRILRNLRWSFIEFISNSIFNTIFDLKMKPKYSHIVKDKNLNDAFVK